MDDHGDGDGSYIRVGVRVRPPLRTSEEGGSMVVDEREGTIAVPGLGQRETFAFSSVHQSQDNAALFEAVGAPLLLRWPRGNRALAPAGQARLWACTTAAAVIVLAFLTRAFLAVAGDAEFGLKLHSGACARPPCPRERRRQPCLARKSISADLFGGMVQGRASAASKTSCGCCCLLGLIAEGICLSLIHI